MIEMTGTPEANSDRKWTAYRLIHFANLLGLVLLGVCLVGLAVGLIIQADNPHSKPSGWLVLAGLLFFGAIGTFWVLGTLGLRRQVVEVSNGYTTMRNRFSDVEQRHPTTGEVIRPAGAPFLSRAEFRKALSGNRDR
jgi:RsiW-degrading membrane proteinase PrsW (M82 family)